MKNPILLYTLLAEFYEDCCEKTMHIDDMKAIKRTMELVTREMPYVDLMTEKEV